MARKFGKKNEVKVDLLKYNLGLLGESGVGKTTIIKEVCEKLAGEDGYIFLECGKEDGADAIHGIVAENVRDWDTFEEIVDDIIENKETDYKDLKVVVIDTYDQLVAIAEPKVIKMSNKENPKKTVKSIKAAFGGYMAGEDKVDEIILEKLWELKDVGVSFFIIGHTKRRDVNDIESGDSYSQLTTDMSLRHFNAIKTKLHVLGIASIDREIVREKTNKKDNKGNDVYKGTIAKESRKITFRDDNYSIDSKSRFAEIVPSIPFNADALIEAITNAIKAEQAKSGKSFEDTQTEQNKEEETRVQMTLARKKITDYIKENAADRDKMIELQQVTVKLGLSKPVDFKTMEEAKEILKLIK